MSCSTDIMRIRLNARDRLIDYHFTRPGCMAMLGGQSLLQKSFQNLSIDEILAIDSETFCECHHADESWKQYYYLKHFIALHSAIAVYTGRQSGGAEDYCSIIKISFDRGITTIEAELALDVVTDKVRHCEKCGGCHKKESSRLSRKRRKVIVNKGAA